MLFTYIKILRTLIISGSLLILQIPAYAGSKEQSVVNNILDGNFNESSKENLLSSISSNAIGAMAASLKNYSSMSSDMVFGSAAGSTLMYSSMASVTDMESEGDSTIETAGIRDIADLLMGNSKKKEDSQDNIEYLSSQLKTMYTAANILENKIKSLNSEIVAFKMAAVVGDILVHGSEKDSKNEAIKGEKEEFTLCEEQLQKLYSEFPDNELIKSSSEKAYKSIDDIISAREEIGPSLEGAKKSIAMRNDFRKNMVELESKLDSAAETYEEEAVAFEAEENLPEAEILHQKSALCEEIKKPIQVKCRSLLATLEKNETSGEPPAPPNPMKSSMETSAQEDETYNAVIARLGPMFDSLMLTPYKRAILWRLLADLAELAIKTHQMKLIEINSQIQSLEKLIRDTREMTSFIKIENIFKSVINFVIPSAFAGVKEASKSKIKSTINFKPPCLASQGNGKCIPLSSKLATMPALRKLDPSMQKLAAQIAKMGDDTNKSPTKLNSAARENLVQVSKQRAKITNYLIKSEHAREDKARSAGVMSINYKNFENKFMGLLNTVTEGVLKRKNITPEVFLASYGGGSFSKTDAFKTDARTSGKAFDIAKRSVSPTGDPILAGKNEEVLEKSEAKKYKTGNIDINTNASSSIFEIISNRYFKSFSSKIDRAKNE